jgi:hypothetical protein
MTKSMMWDSPGGVRKPGWCHSRSDCRRVGSRLAMRILALTSPRAQGSITEAQEVVGRITLAGTLFLLEAGAALGMGGGLVYVAVRRWLPIRGTGLVFGLLMLGVSAEARIPRVRGTEGGSVASGSLELVTRSCSGLLRFRAWSRSSRDSVIFHTDRF